MSSEGLPKYSYHGVDCNCWSEGCKWLYPCFGNDQSLHVSFVVQSPQLTLRSAPQGFEDNWHNCWLHRVSQMFFMTAYWTLQLLHLTPCVWWFFVERERRTDSGVIYCLSRKDCENLSDKLNQKLREKGFRDVRVSFYHADLDPHEKTRRHREWSLGKISVLCATIAFGMGIDKPDVRYVMHYSMPKSITHYYQVRVLQGEWFLLPLR